MRRFLGAALVLTAIAYSIGAVRLSERGSREFLDELEALSLRNEMRQYCDRLHDDLVVSIDDRTSEGGAQAVNGGKQEFCDFVSYAAKGFDLIGPEMTVTRENFTVDRSWLKPWTATVSYHERRTTRMSRINFTLRTEADDRWVLVNTLGGVKVLRLESRSWIAR